MNKPLCRILGTCLILCFLSESISGNIRLPVLISDGMVLQRDAKTNIWGWASPGEKVKIKFNNKTFSTVTDSEGNWKIILSPMKAGGPYSMEVRGRNSIIIENILIGDVWFCSGQSNMVLTMERVKEKYPDDIANANFPEIRNFFVPTASDVTSVHNDLPPGKWISASPESVMGFGAVAFFFARSIYKEYKIPIGIINSSVGGTPIEAWISEEGLKEFPQLVSRIESFKDTAFINPVLRSLARRTESGRVSTGSARGKEGGEEGGREGVKEGGREGENERGREGVKKGGREGVKERGRDTSKDTGKDKGKDTEKDTGNSWRIDRGKMGPKPWYDLEYIPEDWHNFWLPGYLDDQGVKDLDGIIWFRKEIDIPATMTGKPAKLFLGRIVDADEVYVNGVISGSITYQYPPRRYNLPAELLKPGKNIIVVRVTNYAGKGGFVPDKPYWLVAGNDSIDLRGDWLYKVGQVFRPFNAESFTRTPVLVMQNEPTGLYNTMVAPVINYRIKGILWYQGESNTGHPEEYHQLLPALITDWRNKWQQGSIPFIYVQLANFMEVVYLPSESNWAELRYAQFTSLSVPNTAMTVAIDAGEWNDIHPLNKKVVGERSALAARKLAYGEENIVYSGPIYKSLTREGDRLIIEFDHSGSGLMARGGGDLEYFTVAGADKKFVWADAKIDNNHVVVWSDEIPDPVWVRYAWADNPEWANLYNMEGLPASPFEATIIK